jgi:hypothetical protein
MARFSLEIATDVIKDIQKVEKNADKIFGEMTKAGAEVVETRIRENIPNSVKKSEMMKCLKVTDTYKTPSDDGINTKVAFYGYFKDKDGRIKPAPLVANVFEHGRSTSEFPKQPFMRKSFKKKEIEDAMMRVQKELSGGLLDE